MSKLKVAAFSISIDGFGAGPNQGATEPVGAGGMAIFEWFMHTQTFRAMHGGGEGSTGIDNDFAKRSFENIGAWIMGRNMFGPIRGPWPDEAWKGWWGPNPPYHVPVFVLTHNARKAIEMEGGTTFHFVTGGIREAYDRAMAAAQGKDVRVGGGVATVRQYVQAGLMDEMHLVQSSAILGTGEALFTGLDLKKQGFAVAERVSSELATHVVLRRGVGGVRP